MTVLAHAGHWIAQLLYLAPVAGMIAAILYAKIRGRSEDEHDSEENLR